MECAHSGAVTGAARPPLLRLRRFRGLLQGVFTGRSSPPSTCRGLSAQALRRLLVLFLAYGVMISYGLFFVNAAGAKGRSARHCCGPGGTMV